MGLLRTVRLLGSIYMRGSESCMPKSRRTVSFYNIQKGHLSTRRSAGKTSVSSSARVWTAPSSSASPSSSRSQGARGQHADGRLPHLSNVSYIPYYSRIDERIKRAVHLAIHRRHRLRLRPLPCAARRACLGQTRAVTYRWESVQPVQLSDKVDSSSKRISWAALAL